MFFTKPEIINIDEFKNYVLEQYPKETCGVIANNLFVPLENISNAPEKSFKFKPEEYALYIDKTEAIVHSHSINANKPPKFDGRTPSLADRLNQKNSNKLWGIVSCEGENVTPFLYYPHISNTNYFGRQFIPYIDDCFTIIQDYIYFELQKEPPKYKIDYDWINVTNFNEVLLPFLNYPGFIEVDDLNKTQNGDIIVVNHRLGNVSHLGIIHNGQVIHQDVLSTIVPLSNFIGNIVKILRWVGDDK